EDADGQGAAVPLEAAGQVLSEFTLQQKVRFQHCDPAGIVFYPRYFEMVTAAVEEWFGQRLGVPFATLHGPLGGAVPTASMSVGFHAPRRLGEALGFRRS